MVPHNLRSHCCCGVDCNRTLTCECFPAIYPLKWPLRPVTMNSIVVCAKYQRKCTVQRTSSSTKAISMKANKGKAKCHPLGRPGYYAIKPQRQRFSKCDFNKFISFGNFIAKIAFRRYSARPWPHVRNAAGPQATIKTRNNRSFSHRDFSVHIRARPAKRFQWHHPKSSERRKTTRSTKKRQSPEDIYETNCGDERILLLSI